MLIIKKPNNKTLKAIVHELKRGKVIVYPTDTAYGLGCDATNAKAAARIFKIKGRLANKALPMICADEKMVKKYFVLDTSYLILVRKHWPGPLSIIVKAKKGIARAALDRGTAAVRVPDSQIARTLSKLLGRPLVATSANLSGSPACYSINAFLKQGAKSGLFATRERVWPLTSQNRRDASSKGRPCPDLILDAGALPNRKPSTIIKIGKNGKSEVLRRGPVGLDIRY